MSHFIPPQRAFLYSAFCCSPLYSLTQAAMPWPLKFGLFGPFLSLLGQRGMLFFSSTAEMRSPSLISPRCRVMYLSPFSIGFWLFVLLLFLSSDIFVPSFALWF